MRNTFLTVLLLAPVATCCAADTAALPVRRGGTTSPNMVSAATGLPEDPGSCTPRWEVKVGHGEDERPQITRMTQMFVGDQEDR